MIEEFPCLGDRSPVHRGCNCRGNSGVRRRAIAERVETSVNKDAGDGGDSPDLPPKAPCDADRGNQDQFEYHTHCHPRSGGGFGLTPVLDQIKLAGSSIDPLGVSDKPPQHKQTNEGQETPILGQTKLISLASNHRWKAISLEANRLRL